MTILGVLILTLVMTSCNSNTPTKVAEKSIACIQKGDYEGYVLTSSLRHPKIFVKEFSDFLMSCHQHCLGVNFLVQR